MSEIGEMVRRLALHVVDATWVFQASIAAYPIDMLARVLRRFMYICVCNSYFVRNK